MNIDIQGKRIVLTGRFEGIGRKEAAARLEALGAECVSSVTKSTDIVFAGAHAESELARAQALGITIFGEAELLSLLGMATAAGSGAPQATPEGAPPPRILSNAPHRSPLTAVALSPDGRHLATGDGGTGSHGAIAIWELATGRVVNVLEGIEEGVGAPDSAGCLQWSPAGDRIGFNLRTNDTSWADPFAPRRGEDLMTGLAETWDTPPAWCFAPDGSRLFVSCWVDGVSGLPGAITTPAADYSKAKAAATPMVPTPAVPEGLTPWGRCRWRSDGLVVGYNGNAQAYAIDSETRQLRWYQAVEVRALSPDGGVLVTDEACIQFIDGATGGKAALEGEPPARAYVFSQDGRLLAALGEAVRIFSGPEKLATLPVEPYLPGYGEVPDVETLAFSPGGLRVALLTSPNRLEVWAVDGSPERLLAVEGGPWEGVVFGADETLVAAGKEGLTFVDAASGAIRIAHDLYVSPETKRLKLPRRQAWAFPLDEEDWGYVVGGRIVVAPKDPSLRVQATVDGRHAMSLAEAGIPIYPSFEDAAAHAPEVLGEELLSRFGTKRA